MTTLTAPLPFAPPGIREPADLGGLTLEQLLAAAWKDLHGQGAAACPVCGDRMAVAGHAGRCDGCGSELR